MQHAIKIRGLVLFVISTILTTSVLAQNPAKRLQKSPSDISREQTKAVVVLESLDERGNVIGQGSGFIVTPNGAIVTNLHVIKGASSVRVKLLGGDIYKTEDIVDVDEVKDIVILKIKGFQLPTVKLGNSDRTDVGEPIVAISSPEGLINSISTGVISGVRRLDTLRVFQITAPIGSGSSGGALFDSEGSVIGIVTYVFKVGQNINFAVPINYARGMISDQIKTSVANLQSKQQAAQAQNGSDPSMQIITEKKETDEQVEGRLTNAARGRLGRTQQEPMFLRLDEAMIFFYRLVDGIGVYTFPEVADLTRTAAVVQSKETDGTELYTINFLSFYSGVAMSFSKPERLLTSVELLVSWSVEDLERTFGNNYRRRTSGNQKILDFGRQQNGRQLIAIMDGSGIVRAVRFSKAK